MSVPLSNLTDTWNNGATVFSAILMAVTDTASDPNSKLIDLQIGSASVFNVDKRGRVYTLDANHNTVLGALAGLYLTTGTGNVYVGYAAGNRNLTGNNNFAAGFNTLANATSDYNTCVGAYSGINITTGANNTLIGYNAGNSIATGSNNTIIGNYSGTADGGDIVIASGYGGQPVIWVDKYTNCVMGPGNLNKEAMTGTYNLSMGYLNGRNLTAGSYNALFGYSAGTSLTTGSDNFCVGQYAGSQLITGSNNVFLSIYSGANSAGGVNGNVGIGGNTLRYVAGDNNVAVGGGAGFSVTSGQGNTLLGSGAGSNITTGSSNSIVGSYGGTTDLTNHIVLSSGGGLGLFVNSSACLGIGYGGGLPPTGNLGVCTGPYNICVGTGAGGNLTTGNSSTFLGAGAGVGVTTGVSNTLIGMNSGRNIVTGSSNTIIGPFDGSAALSSAVVIATGSGVPIAWFDPVSSSIGLGWGSGNASNIFGGNAASTCVGTLAGFSLSTVSNAFNSLYGYGSGQNITTGTSNTFIGHSSGNSIVTGSYNTIVGSYVGTAAMNNQIVLSDGQGYIGVQYDIFAHTWQTLTTTVGALPAAGSAGRCAFVTDANASTFNSIVAGGGTNGVPVHDDGTNWRIG